MKALLAFRREDLEEDDPGKIECPLNDDLRDVLITFHKDLLDHSGHPGMDMGDEADSQVVQEKPLTWKDRLLALVKSEDDSVAEEDPNAGRPGKTLIFHIIRSNTVMIYILNVAIVDTVQKLIIKTVTEWAKSDFIQNQSLIREMFGLIHRQYDGVGEVIQTYYISTLRKCWHF